MTTLRLSLKAIFAKDRLFKCKCAKERDPNARAPRKLQEQVSCHFHWVFNTRVLSSPNIWPLLKPMEGTLTPFIELTHESGLMPHASNANDYISRICFLIRLKVISTWVSREDRICFSLSSLLYPSLLKTRTAF